MQTRYESSPKETAGMNTAELRNNFLMETLFSANQIHLTYSHYDRMILGGVMPTTETLTLGIYEDLKSEYFLERRELGIINVAGDGKIMVDGQEYLAHHDAHRNAHLAHRIGKHGAEHAKGLQVGV